MENIMEKIERWKLKAKILLNNKEKVFLQDVRSNYYFCEIEKIGDNHLFFYNFTGKRKGTRDRIMWVDIAWIGEYLKDIHKKGHGGGK